MRLSHIRLLFVLLALAPPSAGAQVRKLGLVLPTPNRSIYSDQSRFYMFTDRSFEGRRSEPWQGGKYGYVRNPVRTSAGIVYKRFHEGVDIRPHRRDGAGRPLDAVRSIANGQVVYCNTSSSASSYGRYVVVEHDWGYGRFYSLYAHLSSIDVKAGDRVGPGTRLGQLGYTGAGIDRRRAHVHLELNLLLNGRFAEWHDIRYRTANRHGKYNGLNLAGIDIAGLYLAHRRDPNISIPLFVARMKPYYKVVVPRTGRMEVLRNYPWLGRNMGSEAGKPSWEITFSSSGIPLAIGPSARKVAAPVVSWVKSSSVSHGWNTRNRLTGSGASAKLSSSGQRYIQLVTGQF